MSLRIATFAIPAMLIFSSKTDAGKISDALSYKVITIRDLLSPLHTIPDSMILKINTSFQDRTISVGLKNDSSYTYNHENWDCEDYYPFTPQSIKDALAPLAIACIQNAPGWQPAIQNGHKIPCYKIQEVKFEMP
jgi:hypothetical protein